MTLARRLLIGGGGGFTIPVITPTVQTSAAAGGWTWIHRPRALWYNGYTYFGYSRGDTMAIVLRALSDGLSLGSEITLATNGNVDDHLEPGLLVRDSDHRLMVFYFWGTPTSNDMYLRTSVNSLDTDPSLSGGLSAATMIGSQFTKIASQDYANPIQLTGETSSPIYLFYRDDPSPSAGTWQYSKSTDGGTTWTTHTAFYNSSPNTRWSYVMPVQNGNSRIDFIATDGHPQYDATVSEYHFYYQGGAWFKSDGTSAGSLILDQTKVTKLYDAATGYTSWCHDIAIDASGNPRVVFATFPSTTDHRYNYGYWDGSSWTTREFASAGTYITTTAPLELYYSGGVVLDHADTQVVWASIGQGSGVWDMRRYHTGDNGVTWWNTVILADGGKNLRPLIPNGHGTAVQVLWLTGTYGNYFSYSQGITSAGTV